MARQPDYERKPVVVRLEHRRGRSVGRRLLKDFRYAGGPPLGHLQFLEELANPPVAVAAADGAANLQVLHPDRTIRARKADEDQFVMTNSQFDGFALLVGTVLKLVIVVSLRQSPHQTLARSS